MQTRRIYVDSRHGDLTNNDVGRFSYSLDSQVVLPRDCVAYVTDIALPHSWWSVDETNENLYIVEEGNHGRRIQIPNQNYDVLSLQTQLQNVLNQASDGPGRGGKSVAGTYTVQYDSAKNQYNIGLSGGHNFQHYSREKLMSYDGASDFTQAGGVTVWPLASCDDLLGLRGYDDINSSSMTTGSIDVRNYHQLYLHSDSLTSFLSHGPMGVKSVIARIPVNSKPGETLHKQHSGLIHDFVSCGGVALQNIKFSVRDGNNMPVRLRGHVSFTILFVPQPLI